MALTAEQRLARVTALSTRLKLSAAGVKALEGLTDEDLEGASKELEPSTPPPASTPETASTPAAAPVAPPAPPATTPPAQPASLSAGVDVGAGVGTSAAPTPSPEDLALFRGMMDELRARDNAERTHLISVLSAAPSVSAVFSGDQLTAKPTSELRQLAAIALPQRAVLPPVDFSGRGMPHALAAEESVPAPTSMTDALKTN